MLPRKSFNVHDFYSGLCYHKKVIGTKVINCIIKRKQTCFKKNHSMHEIDPCLNRTRSH